MKGDWAAAGLALAVVTVSAFVAYFAVLLLPEPTQRMIGFLFAILGLYYWILAIFKGVKWLARKAGL